MGDVIERLAGVRAAMARSAADNGRGATDINLIAVSKTMPAEVIVEALEAGQRLFGENYVQESREKWPGLRERFPDACVHMIGPLQSNKAQDAVALFDAIQTLDRESLAKELARAIQKRGRSPEMFVQVNTGEEPQKGGVAPREADAFISRCRDVYDLPVIGLMCIPPVEDQPSPHFAMLNRIAARNGLKGLSMGMSADFEAAIQLGATHVRVGSAIFGARG
jgi:PLP dependent protein